MSRSIGWLAVVLLLALSCARTTAQQTKPLTERQRDSILARSSLAGAGAVGRTLNASDDAARRAASTNAEVDSLFH